MRFFAIGDDLTVKALRLAGIRGVAVSGEEDAAQALRDALEQEPAIVLVDRATAQRLGDRIEQARAARREAIVLEIPDVQGPPEEALSAQKLVAQAIGIKF